MSKTKFHITAEKMVVTLGNGPEQSGDYKIVKRPDTNTIIIKGKEGESTFVRSGKYLCVPTTGAVQFKMYFKPVN